MPPIFRPLTDAELEQVNGGMDNKTLACWASWLSYGLDILVLLV
jgi:bacteriocin-like protein